VTATPAQDVRRTSIRVALAATAVVALAYLVVALAVVAIFTRSQTSQIDSRLQMSLEHPHLPQDGGGPAGPPDSDHPGGLPVLAWLVLPDGTVQKDTYNPFDLPAAYRTASNPQDATIAGTDLRIAGEPVHLLGAATGDGYLVVAQSLDPLYQARGTVILAEVLIAPILLALVFFGAVTIGRRVATPIELARRRQLDFTADASHELRTPLSVIEAHTSLALTQPRDVTWYRTAFERVDRESKRMRRLLDDLLWLARFDATHAPPNVEPVDLGILAAQAADRFGVVAEARNIVLEVGGQDEGAVIAAPPEWLDRLLGVLLDNACKYSPDGGTVRVGVATEGGRVRLTVDDSGPGIAEDQRERIFDRFHRATDGPGGAGLGLAIADAIVRATGGHWQVGRSPTNGARMAVAWAPAFGGRRDPAVASPRSRTAASD
jgi:two-component system, OmpR family, sensor histidine kinase CiaH